MHADQNLALHPPQGQIQSPWTVVSSVSPPLALVISVKDSVDSEIVLGRFILHKKDPRLITSDLTQNDEEACSVMKNGPMGSNYLILHSYV